MATSGTVGQTAFNVQAMIEAAIRRSGMKADSIGAETAMIARTNLYLYLSHLANQGVNLWCLDKQILAVYPQQYVYDLPVGTIDVLNCNYRSLTRISGGTPASAAGGTAANAFDGDTTTACTQTSTLGNISYDAGIATQVTTVGYLPHASATLTLVFEYSTDNSTWTTAKTVASQAYAAGQWYWADLTLNTEARYWRVRAAAGTLDAAEVFFGNTPAEIVMSRLNRDDYVALPNKATTGRALQFWFDRQRTQPRMWVWPVPTDTFEQIIAWRHRHIEDVGALTNDVEIPQRWLEAVTMHLAWKLALETPGADMQRLSYLKQLAEEEEFEASNEERDNSPIYYNPAIIAYTK
jgi:hypothetical protein